MRATTQLEVKSDMRITLTLELSVQEMDELLRLTADEGAWPMWKLRTVLNDSLSKARAAYSSQHVHE